MGDEATSTLFGMAGFRVLAVDEHDGSVNGVGGARATGGTVCLGHHLSQPLGQPAPRGEVLGRLLGEGLRVAELLVTPQPPLAPEHLHLAPGHRPIGQGHHRALFHPGRERPAADAIRLANQVVTAVRCRRQQELTGHRGRKGDVLHGVRRVLLRSSHRPDDRRRELRRRRAEHLRPHRPPVGAPVPQLLRLPGHQRPQRGPQPASSRSSARGSASGGSTTIGSAFSTAAGGRLHLQSPR